MIRTVTHLRTLTYAILKILTMLIVGQARERRERIGQTTNQGHCRHWDWGELVGTRQVDIGIGLGIGIYIVREKKAKEKKKKKKQKKLERKLEREKLKSGRGERENESGGGRGEKRVEMKVEERGHVVKRRKSGGVVGKTEGKGRG